MHTLTRPIRLPAIPDTWHPSPLMDAVALLGGFAVLIAFAGLCWWAMGVGGLDGLPVVGF